LVESFSHQLAYHLDKLYQACGVNIDADS
jgi:hypothetical protein